MAVYGLGCHPQNIIWTICYIILNKCKFVRRHVFVIVYLRQKTSLGKIWKKTLYWSGPVNILKYWTAVLTKTNRENKNVKYNTIIYIFSVVYNFELIVGLGVGIPLFFIIVGLIIVLCVYNNKRKKSKDMEDDLDR